MVGAAGTVRIDCRFNTIQPRRAAPAPRLLNREVQAPAPAASAPEPASSLSYARLSCNRRDFWIAQERGLQILRCRLQHVRPQVPLNSARPAHPRPDQTAIPGMRPFPSSGCLTYAAPAIQRQRQSWNRGADPHRSARSKSRPTDPYPWHPLQLSPRPAFPPISAMTKSTGLRPWRSVHIRRPTPLPRAASRCIMASVSSRLAPLDHGKITGDRTPLRRIEKAPFAHPAIDKQRQPGSQGSPKHRPEHHVAGPSRRSAISGRNARSRSLSKATVHNPAGQIIPVARLSTMRQRMGKVVGQDQKTLNQRPRQNGDHRQWECRGSARQSDRQSDTSPKEGNHRGQRRRKNRHRHAPRGVLGGRLTWDCSPRRRDPEIGMFPHDDGVIHHDTQRNDETETD